MLFLIFCKKKAKYCHKINLDTIFKTFTIADTPAGEYRFRIIAYDRVLAAGNPIIQTIESDGTSRYFDLQGRMLNGKPVKGLYIEDGRKIIIK
jgi:hypothetical protein